MSPVELWVQLAAALCELGGAFLLANGLTSAAKARFPLRVVISALWRGDAARGAVFWPADDDRLRAIQGLGFILLGFAIQVGFIGWSLLSLLVR